MKKIFGKWEGMDNSEAWTRPKNERNDIIKQSAAKTHAQIIEDY